jgi:hypothetical protein
MRHAIRFLALLALTATAQEQTVTLAEGDRLELVSTADGIPSPDFIWRRDGGAVASGNLLLVEAVTPSDAGTYLVVAKNSEGEASSDPYNVLVTAAPVPPPPPEPPPPSGVPVFTLHPSSQEVPALADATFTVAATGLDPISFQWFLQDAPIDGATAATFIAGPSYGSNSYFSVAATNTVGTTRSNAAALWRTAAPTPPPVIDPPPPPPPEEPPPPAGIAPTITTGPQSQTVAKFTSVRFYVVAEGTEPLVYQWFYNGVSIPGATGPEHRINRVTPGMRGAYEVVVENAFGSKISRATLTVRN